MHPNKIEEIYKRLAPYQTLMNNASRVSLLSSQYTKIIPKTIGGLGKVYLAPQQRTVVLSEEAMVKMKTLGLRNTDILGCANSGKDNIEGTMLGLAKCRL